MKKSLKKMTESLPGFGDLQDIVQELRQLHWLHRLTATTAYIQAVEAIKAGDPRYRDPERLLMHGAQCWSQNLEDGMITEIFRRVGTTTKTFLEIGVGNGTENNTTLLLAMGWTGWWLEGNPAYCQSIAAHLQKMPKVAKRLTVQEALVSPENVGGLLAKLGIPQEIDLFSLDIDVNTYHIWAALEKFRPRVIVVEYNAMFPPEFAWIHPYRSDSAWDRTQAWGASLKAYEKLGARFGYSLVGCDMTGTNAFLVRNDQVGDKFCAPFSAENHHEPARYFLSCRMAHPASFYLENAAET